MHLLCIIWYACENVSVGFLVEVINKQTSTTCQGESQLMCSKHLKLQHLFQVLVCFSL